MTTCPRLLVAACAALLALTLPHASRADEFTAPQKSEIERIVREYLVMHPEVLQEAMTELEKRQTAAEAEKHKAAVKDHAQNLFSSPRQVVLGNADGNVTFVEFFDYNCAYCKRAMSDMLTLMKDDPKLKVVLKEFPVLGPGSVEAAQVAVAVRMQDKSGKKYLDFHQRLLGGRGQADKSHALAAAKDAGLNMAQIEKDMTSPEVKATLQENFKIAEALGLNGTPSYVFANEVVVGSRAALDASEIELRELPALPARAKAEDGPADAGGEAGQAGGKAKADPGVAQVRSGMTDEEKLRIEVAHEMRRARRDAHAGLDLYKQLLTRRLEPHIRTLLISALHILAGRAQDLWEEALRR